MADYKDYAALAERNAYFHKLSIEGFMEHHSVGTDLYCLRCGSVVVHRLKDIHKKFCPARAES